MLFDQVVTRVRSSTTCHAVPIPQPSGDEDGHSDKLSDNVLPQIVRQWVAPNPACLMWRKRASGDCGKPRNGLPLVDALKRDNLIVFNSTGG